MQPYMTGILTLLASFAPKYIYDDLDDWMDDYLNCELMRKIYIFAFLYLATKDLETSIILLLVYMIFMFSIRKQPKTFIIEK
jgi:hypothetical protein